MCDDWQNFLRKGKREVKNRFRRIQTQKMKVTKTFAKCFVITQNTATNNVFVSSHLPVHARGLVGRVAAAADVVCRCSGLCQHDRRVQLGADAALVWRTLRAHVCANARQCRAAQLHRARVERLVDRTVVVARGARPDDGRGARDHLHRCSASR